MVKGSGLFRMAKLYWPYDNWEPFFLGTHTDPLFDERLTWEGKRNKMTLAYQMCVLIHREGFKRSSHNQHQACYNCQAGPVKGQNVLIQEHILPTLNRLFGTKKGCML